jgi:hypothetical protein
MDCGKQVWIEVEKGKNIKSGWGYWGKLNIHSCETSKYFLTPRDPNKPTDFNDMVRVENKCYNPLVKPKYVELWSCPECIEKQKESDTT